MPVSGVYRPDTRLNKVVLPAPFGPIKAWISPAFDRQAGTGDRANSAELFRDVSRPAAPFPLSSPAAGSRARGKPW